MEFARKLRTISTDTLMRPHLELLNAHLKRAVTITVPMRGIPAVNTCKLSAGFTNEPRKFQRQLVKREGGAKLIDIDEIPHALKQRRREQEAEEKAKKLLEKQELKKKHQAEKAERVGAGFQF